MRHRGYTPGAMKCATPLVLAALSGTGPPPHAGVFAPPFDTTTTAPPAAGKAVWGASLEHQLTSDNFVVGWEGDSGSADAAQRVLDVLELAWINLVLELGWTPPTSSDDYLLWIVLDPSVGHTGYTALVDGPDYPEGVPYIYMNPDYAAFGSFWEHLAVHEFNHMLHYRLRDYTGGDKESWYWEASAEWGVELGAPDLDVYAVQQAFYALKPEARYDTIDGQHEYGMLGLNAWLDEHGLGPGGLRDVWDEAQDRPGDDWVEILEDLSGASAGQLWADFTAALSNGALREANLYTPPTPLGPVDEGSSGKLALLGTDAWEVTADAVVRVDGDAILGAPWGHGSAVRAWTGDVLTVTALKQNANYSLSLGDVDEPLDTGGPGDSGGSQNGDGGGGTGLPDDDGVGCGCQSTGGSGLAWPLLALLGAVLRQRRSVATPACRRV